jgi:hypothetical protein
MNFEDIATDSKWNLLKELAKGKKSASDLAKKTEYNSTTKTT